MSMKTLFEKLALIPALLLLILGLLTFIDVVGRNVFTAPLRGSFDIISYLVAVVVFTSAPFIARARGHIVVDLLDPLYSPRARRIRDGLIEVICGGAMLLLCWWIGIYAWEAYQFDRVSPDISIPIWPVAGLCSVTSFMTALIHFGLAISDFRGKE
ncbi:TRAP-type C4-dicarboxylate transport system permease small subunit [Paenochrobactrum gallinarii]|uniref:TRAP transporter small permease protein n=1 Tax=Paenochrobactrum gallinarii TaxID=643673 RepID=A0A841LQL7_9HYPH|nr:TRAP transporter small permease [Paenochrobactrum gallinarii]MBB6260375.1 TRAP-type C4-dicarboxylate transport system permease small subunit [Paenochrobactrum gallinarii]